MLNSDCQEVHNQLISLLFIIPGVALSVYLVLCDRSGRGGRSTGSGCVCRRAPRGHRALCGCVHASPDSREGGSFALWRGRSACRRALRLPHTPVAQGPLCRGSVKRRTRLFRLWPRCWSRMVLPVDSVKVIKQGGLRLGWL